MQCYNLRSEHGDLATVPQQLACVEFVVRCEEVTLALTIDGVDLLDGDVLVLARVVPEGLNALPLLAVLLHGVNFVLELQVLLGDRVRAHLAFCFQHTSSNFDITQNLHRLITVSYYESSTYFDEIEFLLQELFIIDGNWLFKAEIVRHDGVKSEKSIKNTSF